MLMYKFIAISNKIPDKLILKYVKMQRVKIDKTILKKKLSQKEYHLSRIIINIS